MRISLVPCLAWLLVLGASHLSAASNIPISVCFWEINSVHVLPQPGGHTITSGCGATPASLSPAGEDVDFVAQTVISADLVTFSNDARIGSSSSISGADLSAGAQVGFTVASLLPGEVVRVFVKFEEAASGTGTSTVGKSVQVSLPGGPTIPLSIAPGIQAYDYTVSGDYGLTSSLGMEFIGDGDAGALLKVYARLVPEPRATILWFVAVVFLYSARRGRLRPESSQQPRGPQPVESRSGAARAVPRDLQGD